MGFDLRAGESMLEAAVKITDVQMGLQPVVEALSAASDMVNLDAVYEGGAQDDISRFYFEYLQNINKLVYYYSLAARYIPMALDEMISLDEKIAAMTDAAERDQAKAAIMEEMTMSLADKLIAQGGY